MANILLVDDNDSFRRGTRQLLERSGHQVWEARHGVEAIRVLRRIAPDLVITDLFMPEKDGIETIQELKRQVPDVPIIAVSGGSPGGLQNNLHIAAFLGATLTLAKPFDTATLMEAVQSALASQHPELRLQVLA